MKLTFYYVRHGKTIFNVDGRMQGMCDSPLLPEGIEGARDTASALRNVHFDACYCSSSERAWDTAKILCEPHQIEPVLSKDLREFDFGTLDGMYLKDVRTSEGDEFVREDWSEYGGDTMASFKERSDRIFNRIVRESHDGDTVLVVSHGAYMMHLMDTLFDYDRFDYVRRCNQNSRPWMPNCGICIFTYEDGVWSITHEPMCADEYRNEFEPKRVVLHFVRHGQTLFNTKQLMQGYCDSPLTQTGIAQAKKAGSKLKDVPIERAFVSTTERTRDTASIILRGREHVSIIYDKRLREVYFGRLEGLPMHVEKPEDRECLDHMDFTRYDGETGQQAGKRLISALRDIIDTCRDGEHVLIVSHGMMYMVMMEILFGITHQMMFEMGQKEGRDPVPNGGVFTFVYDHGRWSYDHLME
ncbi:MAG: histidine phosphatase family protein [Bulleidia sp.]